MTPRFLSRRGRLGSIPLLLLLSACHLRPVLHGEGAPAPAPPEEPAAVTSTPAPRGEDPFAALPGVFRAKAMQAEKGSAWRDALLRWRVVLATLPEDVEAAGKVEFLEGKIRKESREHLLKGKEFIEKKEPEEARRELLAALALNPELSEAAEGLKRLYAQSDRRIFVGREGDTAKTVARDIYGDAGKDFLVSWFNDLPQGGGAIPAGTPLRLPLLEPVASPRPSPAAGDPLERARSLYRAGSYEKAAAYAEKALEKAPSLPEARELRNGSYYQWGASLLRRKDYVPSLKAFRKVDPSFRNQREMVAFVLARQKEEGESRFAAGQRLYRSGDLEGAALEWEYALRADPEHGQARRELQRVRGSMEKGRKGR